MERRTFLRGLFGGVVAAASLKLMTTDAEAALMPIAPDVSPSPEPAVLTPEDQANAKVEMAYHGRWRRRHHHGYWRRRRMWRRHRVRVYRRHHRMYYHRPRRVYYY